MDPDSPDPRPPSAGPGGPALRSVAHDLGNLAARLTMLSANLQAQIPDEGHRSEAVALLEDTALRLREAITKLREAGRGL